MTKATPGDRLRYQVDNFLSRGTAALIAALLTVTACLILSAAGILVAANLGPSDRADSLGFAEAIWLATTRVLDSGAFVDDSGWSYRLVGFLVTLGGIFLSSALIGILVSGLDQHLDRLRRGRTPVVEFGHMLILGWSPQIHTLLHELDCANQGQRLSRPDRPDGLHHQRSACVVILAERDRLEMEAEIRLRAPKRLGTRIICRSGDPLDPDVLKIVSPETARATIILSPGGEHPDMPVGKALLALARSREQLQHHSLILTTIQHPENLPVMRMIGGEGAHIFPADRMLGYLIAQACLQPGLAPVFSELLRFQGANIHIASVPELAGGTYGEALDRLANATLIGVQSEDRSVRLNPSPDTSLQPGDRLVVLRQNGVPVQVSNGALVEPNRQAVRLAPLPPQATQRLLILGWNSRAPIILEHLSHAAHRGLQVKVFASHPPGEMQTSFSSAGDGPLRVTFEEGSPLDRLSLEKLVAEDYGHILILRATSLQEIELADVCTRVSYLHLRDIAAKTGRSYSILSELMSVEKGDPAVFNDPADATISSELVALALAQIAEDEEIVPVLADLLGPGGSHIVLRPFGDYVAPGEQVDFQTVAAAVRCRGETALGYRLVPEVVRPGHPSGVYLNPERSTRIAIKEQDRVIVLTKET